MSGDAATLIVLMPGTYGLSSVHFTGDGWQVTAAGRLIVRAGREVAGEFAPGHWAAVVDDSHRQPDLSSGALIAARRALARIHEGCGTGMTIGQIARLAEDGLMEVST